MFLRFCYYFFNPGPSFFPLYRLHTRRQQEARAQDDKQLLGDGEELRASQTVMLALVDEGGSDAGGSPEMELDGEGVGAEDEAARGGAAPLPDSVSPEEMAGGSPGLAEAGASA